MLCKGFQNKSLKKLRVAKNYTSAAKSANTSPFVLLTREFMWNVYSLWKLNYTFSPFYVLQNVAEKVCKIFGRLLFAKIFKLISEQLNFWFLKYKKLLPTFDDVLIINASNDAAEDLDEYEDDACAESQNTVSGTLTSCARHASASARVQHATYNARWVGVYIVN